MTEFDKTIDAYVRKNPLVFLGMANDEVVLLKASEAVKLSTGFEIECSPKEGIDIKAVQDEFNAIPYILHADVNFGEQRFRIPEGINGLLCLYFITIKLKKYFELNLGSGIHYHIDLQGVNNKYKIHNLLFDSNYNSSWILRELEKWNYQGTYNTKRISSNKGNWFVVRNSLDTIEIRIGEMTFDYELLIERIIHSNKIVLKLMSEVGVSDDGKWAKNTSINTKLILDYLKYKDDTLLRKLNEITEKLAKLKEKYHVIDDNKLDRNTIESFVNNRLIKI